MIFYRLACIASAVAQSILFVALFLSPEAMIASFGVETNETVAFVARRASILFLGLALLSAFSILVTSHRTVMAVMLSVPWFGLAMMGAYEHLRGFVGAEIYPAIATELSVGSLLLVAAIANASQRRTA